MGESALSFEDVTFAYVDEPVIEEVTLLVERGDFVGVVGPNGSGKSTLLKLALGLLQPDSGRVSLFGDRPTDDTARRRVGYVPQRGSEVDRRMPITVEEVVSLGRVPSAGFKRFDGDDRTRVREALERVGIESLIDRRVGSLSGGQRQRTLVARALAADAELLVLDEPTVGIDASARESLYALLDSLNDEGITIVLIDHDLSTLIQHVDRIAQLNRTLDFFGEAQTFRTKVPVIADS